MLVHITPEETVRQSFLSFLINDIHIPLDRLLVEEQVAKHQIDCELPQKGRIDILVLNNENRPFLIYECKKPTETFTINVYKQIEDYCEALKTIEYAGVVIGDIVDFMGIQLKNGVDEVIYYAEHPKYLNLCFRDEDVYVNEYSDKDFKRPNFVEPIASNEIEEYINDGIIGEGTDRKLLPFVINLLGWINDVDDKLEKESLKDLGLKYTKFGNAGGGYFTNHYRAYLMSKLDEKPIVFIGITSMVSGENSPIGTSIFVAIETNEHSHSSLQLRVDRYIKITNNIAEIEHDGTITIGKLGAAKRQELLDYVKNNSPNLIVDNKVKLGKIDYSIPITSENETTKTFLNNLIEYALLRDEFRKIKKGIS